MALRLSRGAVPGCGDGIANGAEQCDGVDLDANTCQTLGYTLGGALACTAGCSFDTSGCASQQFPASGHTTATWRRARRCRTPTTATARSRSIGAG